MASHQEELGRVLESVGYRSSSHPVIVGANEAMSLQNYLIIAADEVRELAEEHDKWKIENESRGEKTPLPKSWLMELYDVLVTLRTAKARIAPKFSVEHTIFSVNGQFHDNFNSLADQVLNLGDGQAERNLELIITELLSMIKHLDVNLQAQVYVELVNKKLEANKASKFYQKEPGMNESDVLAKYEHVTTALRILRRFLRKATGQEITLQPWITDFFAEEILDWRNSKAALIFLQQKILLFQQQIKDEMFWKLSPSKVHGRPSPDKSLLDFRQDVGDSAFELRMLIAGAVPLSAPKYQEVPALQSSSSNATLGKTIFWT